MINPFTAEPKIRKIQQEVLRPLYTLYDGQNEAQHNWLLVETGRAISSHQQFIEEVCRSRLVSAIFKIIKMLGGADQLTEDDFARFTAYVNDGGIQAMLKMLLSANKEKTFVDELKRLPLPIQRNAPLMLEKSKSLHRDFIAGFFKESHGSVKNTPQKLRDNFAKSDEFINRLAYLADENLKKMS
jgi:hypothetical protein